MPAGSQNTKTAIEYAVRGIWETKSSNHFRPFLIVGLITLCLGNTSASRIAIADPFEDAKAAFERSDYATALAIFRPLADQGDATAHLYPGEMYMGGGGVKNDEKVAA